MQFQNLWRVLFITCFSFFIAACKPIPSFTYSPDPVVVGQAIAFEATTLTGDHDDDEDDEDHDHEKKHKTKKVIKKLKKLTFNWNFGDGGTATGLTATHTFTEVGSKTVTLTVSNRKGESAVVSKVIAVLPATTTTTAALTVLVQGADGVRVNGAQIKIGSNAVATNTTDANGVATVSSSSTGTQTVVVSKPGYITQALNANLATTAAANLNFILLPVKEVKTIANIEQAQLITAQTLGASVLLPANALVNASGQPVTGTVTLELTPWDISTSDLNAMPGNGRARAADGSAAELISAGMLTVNFFQTDASGVRQHLQLDAANTKTATIQMDIPYAPNPTTYEVSINGVTLTQGLSIPMWTFDEAQGLWLEEGAGTVEHSNRSPSGLAVKATVKHFSTWNWDFKFDGGGTVTVQCQQSGATVPCSILAEVTLPDGSRITKTSYGVIGAPTTVINMPSMASIVWTGTSPGGEIGTALSGASGNVIIVLAPPRTSNFVQCTVQGVAVNCDARLTALATDESVFTRSFYLAASGSTINTAVDTTSTLTWSGSTRLIQEGAQLVRYEGTVTSSISGSVTVALGTRVIVASKTLNLKCDPVADVLEYGYDANENYVVVSTTTVAVTSCNINVEGYYRDFQDWFTFESGGIPVGTLFTVLLPPQSDTEEVYINAQGSSALNNYLYSYRNYEASQLSNNQTIVMRFVLDPGDNCGGTGC